MYRVKASTEIADPGFDIGLTTNYEISIQATPDGFSFCIANPETYHILYIKEYQFVDDLPLDDMATLIGEINYSDDLLRLPYRQIKLMYAPSRLTFIPDALYDPNQATSLLDSLYMDTRLHQTVFTNPIKTLDMWSIASMPTPLYEALTNYQPAALLYNTSVPICQRMLSERYTGGETQIIVNKFRQSFDLFVTENGRLTLHNQYKSINCADMTYFIVNVIDQLNLDADRLSLRLLGDFNTLNQDINFLRKYIPNVVYERNHSIFHGRVVDKIEIHRYLNLMNLHLCE
ncbi:MAG: DUF3822 family protein [Salinivirgaceae bacterium]|nr:DUF3822 family protein [Salinivirgaceae bacterium]